MEKSDTFKNEDENFELTYEISSKIENILVKKQARFFKSFSDVLKNVEIHDVIENALVMNRSRFIKYLDLFVQQTQMIENDKINGTVIYDSFYENSLHFYDRVNSAYQEIILIK